MNELRIFQNSEFGELKVMEIGEKVYFPATACAKVLGYKDTTNAIKLHCRWVAKHHLPHPQNSKKEIIMNYIPEGDLYRLIAHSRLPAAERFERWVFDEVLPAIRKEGLYAPDIAEIVRQTVKATIEQMNAPKKRRRIGGRGAVSTLAAQDTEVRQAIEDMLLSHKFTYLEIVENLWKMYAIRTSTSAVGRYAQMVYEREAECVTTLDVTENEIPMKVYIDDGEACQRRRDELVQEMLKGQAALITIHDKLAAKQTNRD